eukprot:COSAG05_NODE_11746_length_498_cov_233.666667_2_plen_21_part_01
MQVERQVERQMQYKQKKEGSG